MTLLNVQEYRVYLTAEDLSDLLRNFPDLVLDLGSRIVPKHTAVSPLSEKSESPLFPGSREYEISPREPLSFHDVTEDDSRAEEEHSESEEREIIAQKEEGIGAEDELEAESEAHVQSQGEEEAQVIKKTRQKKENETAVLNSFKNLEHNFQSLVEANTQQNYENRLQKLQETIKTFNFRKMTMAQKKEFLKRIENFRKIANPKGFPVDVSFLWSFSFRSTSLEQLERGPSVKEEELHLQRLSKKGLKTLNIATKLNAERKKTVAREDRIENAKAAARSLGSGSQTPLEYVKQLLMIASAVEELESIPALERSKQDTDRIDSLKQLVKNHHPHSNMSANLSASDSNLFLEVIETLTQTNKFDPVDKLKSLMKRLEALQTEEQEKNKQDMEKLRMEERSQEFDVLFKKWKGAMQFFLSSHSDDPNISLLKGGFNDVRQRYLSDDSNERKEDATRLLEKVLQDWKSTIELKIQAELMNVENALLHDKTKAFRALKKDEKNSFRVNEKMSPEEFLDRLNLFYNEEFIDAVKKRMNREHETNPVNLWLPDGRDIDEYYNSRDFATLRQFGLTKNDILRPLKFPWFR